MATATTAANRAAASRASTRSKSAKVAKPADHAAESAASQATPAMSEADIIRKLHEYDRLSLESKKLYEQRDMLEAELLEVLQPGDIIQLADGRSARVVDNFAPEIIDKKTGKRRNKVWRVAGVSRFEIEFTKAGK